MVVNGGFWPVPKEVAIIPQQPAGVRCPPSERREERQLPLPVMSEAGELCKPPPEQAGEGSAGETSTSWKTAVVLLLEDHQLLLSRP